MILRPKENAAKLMISKLVRLTGTRQSLTWTTFHYGARRAFLARAPGRLPLYSRHALRSWAGDFGGASATTTSGGCGWHTGERGAACVGSVMEVIINGVDLAAISRAAQ